MKYTKKACLLEEGHFMWSRPAMKNKIKRLSYNQLKVLSVFLGKRGNMIVTPTELEKKTGIMDKSLGGVISSLTRTRFRNIPLIEPVGRAADYSGLRWILNDHLFDTLETKKEVNKLIRLYEN